MKSKYASFALSYRQWHYRTTPEAMGGMDPALGLGGLHALNIFSLFMLLPANALPSWLFVLLPIFVGLLFSWHINRIYRDNPAPLKFAKLTDSLPSFREVPLVYSYFLCSLLLLVGCLYLAVRGAA